MTFDIRVYSQRMEYLRNGMIGKTGGREQPTGVVLFGIFLFFGAAMAALAGTTLSWRGTILDGAWSIEPEWLPPACNSRSKRRDSLFPFSSGLMVIAGIGWFLTTPLGMEARRRDHCCATSRRPG